MSDRLSTGPRPWVDPSIAPSIDQLGAAVTILQGYADPTRGGELVHDFSATLGPTTGIYWLCVCVTISPDEIYAQLATRVYAIRGDGSYDSATRLDGWHTAESLI